MDEVLHILCYRDRGFRHGRRPCVVSIDTSCSSVASDVRCRPAETGQVELAADELLRLHVFIDRSIVEVFVNGKQCLGGGGSIRSARTAWAYRWKAGVETPR